LWGRPKPARVDFALMQVTQDLAPEALALRRTERGTSEFRFPLREADGLMLHDDSDNSARCSRPSKSLHRAISMWEMTRVEKSRIADE